jgi:hypothetical protein
VHRMHLNCALTNLCTYLLFCRPQIMWIRVCSFGGTHAQISLRHRCAEPWASSVPRCLLAFYYPRITDQSPASSLLKLALDMWLFPKSLTTHTQQWVCILKIGLDHLSATPISTVIYDLLSSIILPEGLTLAPANNFLKGSSPSRHENW